MCAVSDEVGRSGWQWTTCLLAVSATVYRRHSNRELHNTCLLEAAAADDAMQVRCLQLERLHWNQTPAAHPECKQLPLQRRDSHQHPATLDGSSAEPHLMRSSAQEKPPSTASNLSCPLGGSPRSARMFWIPAFLTYRQGRTIRHCQSCNATLTPDKVHQAQHWEDNRLTGGAGS